MEQTWLVLQRDLTVWLRNVRGPSFLTIVLDLTDHSTRALGEGPAPAVSLQTALQQAATEPFSHLEPVIPDRIQAPTELAAHVRSVVARLEVDAGFRADTIVEEVVPEEGAEWVFDVVITEMAGRKSPEESLALEDSIFLYEHARRFMEAQPWTRWSSQDALLVELKLGTQKMEGIATVVGHQLTQPGLFLMPGREPVRERMASFSAPPLGTLFMQLEGAESQPDLFIRARRYGWPPDAAVTPIFISVREEGFREIDRRESLPLALVLAGVVEHFQRGDVAETWGHLDLPTGHRGRYRVRKAPEPRQKAEKGRHELLGIKISADLMPDGSELQVGVMGLDLLAEVRKEADVSLPPSFPVPAGITRIPMIVMIPSDRDFTGVVDRLRRAKPLGVTVLEQESTDMLTILGERAGFVISEDPRSATVWKQNIKASDGAHVLIITDDIVNQDEPDRERPSGGALGRIYGLFECMMRGGSTRAIEAERITPPPQPLPTRGRENRKNLRP